ncbi:helix-turn-helix domain containing protein, partial [Ligilactobacillus equi]|uniref:helix-turn-helix domain containing protein n=2 Tax=Ligilactobacillus equi TaxID=137357 RepID=UPI00046A1BCF
MGRKPKFNSAQKLSILKEAKEKGIYEISKKYSIDKKTIQQWCLLYKYQGIEGLKSKRTNQSYSLSFKISLVTAFMESGDSLMNFAIKNGLKSHRQLYNWIKRYNEGTLKAYQPRKRDLNLTKKRNSTRKTTFEERLEIIEFLIKHDINYHRTAEKYDVSYAQVYS